ncbi:MAG: aminomethyl-transferring glycine dehydrogenase subunit GcvPA [Gammaproteobacteria bacterium]|nr:aminomethyl-transferring glycine dehydrogenase subunit GcvPA [Gammaproteobacteria bacterium]
MPYIPHTKDDIASMLQEVGVSDIDELFSEIPQELQTSLTNKIDLGINEFSITKLMQKKAELDYGVQNYIGAGAYEHHIPAAVWDIAGRGEFMTSYTPYQAEASQGTLQLIYEYQTMMCSLTGMDVSNASMYDGASALAESILMSVRSNKKTKSQTVLLLGTINPNYLDTVKTIVSHQNIEIVTTDFDQSKGVITQSELNIFEQSDLVAVAIMQPNFFGQLEDVDLITDWAHAKNALVIGVVNPISLALLKPPAKWGNSGADIVCGEGQSLGVPLASGGPYFGFLCCREELVRQMPGRIVGMTTDQDGKAGFVLTLQAREQHIRRSKATSNICTNQGLLVTAGTIYMSLLGFEGLSRVARTCWNNTTYLIDKLCQNPDLGIKRKFQGDYFHEVTLEFDPTKFTTERFNQVLDRLNKKQIAAGYNLNYLNISNLKNCLLVCVTETKDYADLDYYATIMGEIVGEIC